MKKAQSQVIATILLILIVIASISIIISFIIPFIKNQLSTGDCFKIAGKIKIKNNPKYTCYDSVRRIMKVQIYSEDVYDFIKDFKIIIESEGSSKSFGIFSENAEVSMLTANPLEFPGKNQEKTYVISNIETKPNLISIYPILKNNKNCENSDSLNIITNC